MTLSGLPNTHCFYWFKLILLWFFLLGHTTDSYTDEIIEPKRGSELRKILLDTVRDKAEQELQSKILFKVDSLRTDGHWAFLSAIPVSHNLTEIDFAKTKYAKQYVEGLFDNSLTALLVKEAGKEWRIIEFSIGSTDANFVDWPEKYLVPERIILSE